MKKKVFLVLTLVISHLIIFLAGSTTGKNLTMDYIANQSERANAQVSLGHYTIYRDIAKDIMAGKYDSAKCNAELGASAMLDSVKSCLASRSCGATAEKQMRTSAPEIFGDVPLEFLYINSKDGIKRCSR